MKDLTNQIRRAKVKLELFEQEGTYGLLSDLIDIINEEISRSKLSSCAGDGEFTEEGKKFLIDNVKNKYKKLIKENGGENGRQQTLF